MKKRKTPTGLIIALVLFVCTAAGINAFQMGLLRPSAEAPKSAELSAARETKDSSKDIAAKTKSSLGDIKKKAMEMENPMAPKHDGPLIAVPKFAKQKYVPKPNDSSIAGQWYAPESMNSDKSRN
jgi:hypothetical protein